MVRFINMNNYDCTIADISGKVIKHFIVADNDETINLSVANGLYIVSAANGNEIINCKVVVK